MESLIFATNNQHKVDEVKLVLGNQFHLITLREAGIEIDIPEPHDTLEANAKEKSTTIYQLTGKNCFSEDTGLEVMALNGEPGVKSARYAGDAQSFEDNVAKLLNNMVGISARQARFRTVISLIIAGNERQFEGVCEGKIAEFRTGGNGFGYDPVFIPDGSAISFGEMNGIEKSAFSHRKKAMDKLIDFLKQSMF
ncbi:MAG: RdgB/HAM1 family non-canonical purine NTP pyrophosphatase [Ferruginibacter sp.]|nr:RdgB/HAM1 family non-canonical purine NTP pyrophosphatase [Ferruginibacter sp.]